MERSPSPATWSHRIALGAGIALATLALAACDEAEAPHDPVALSVPDVPAPAPLPEPEPAPIAVPATVVVDLDGTPCADLAAIKDPPTLVGKPVDDPAYTALKAHADAAVPCLLDAMVSGEPLDDAQKIPGHTADFTVGDLAFFLLVDFGFVDFARALPPDVSQATLTRGPFAYFDWIVVPGNRERLQARVREQIETRQALAQLSTPR